MIEIHATAPTAKIVLDRAATHNALDPDMVALLAEAFDDLRQEKRVRTVVLTANGDTFCSGVDLKSWHATMQAGEDALEEWEDIAANLQTLLEQMLRFPKIIIAAVGGGAIGFGAALPLCCDLTVCTERAYLELPAPRRGLVSGLVAPLLSFRFGAAAAARLLLGNERIDGRTATSLGWFHRCVPHTDCVAAAEAWGNSLADSAPEAVQMTKRVLNEMIGESMMQTLSSGAAAMASVCSTEAATEGVSAFLQKRPAEFP